MPEAKISPPVPVIPGSVSPTEAPVISPTVSVPEAKISPTVPVILGSVSPTEAPVISPTVSVPEAKISPTVPVAPGSATHAGEPVTTPLVSLPGENSPSTASVPPTLTAPDSPASTGGQPTIIIPPTLPSTTDFVGTTGGVPPAVVSPSSSQPVSVPVSQPPPPSNAPITFGPSGVLTTSGIARSTEPGPAEPSATGNTASSIIFGPSGTVSPTASPIGTPVSNLPSPVGTSGTNNPVNQQTTSGLEALTSGTGTAKIEQPSGTSVGVAPTPTVNTSDGLASGAIATGTASQSQATSPPSGVSAPVPGTTDALPTGQSTAGNLGATASGATPSASGPAQTAAPSENIAPSLTSHGSGVTTNSPAETGPVAASASPTESPSFIPFTTGTTPSIDPTAARSQQATGTDTFTAQIVPSSIVADPTKSVPTASETAATGIPSNVPHIITPPYGVPVAPPNTTLIQIGFLYPLNYEFVLAHMESQQQIFKYLPEGIAYGLDIPTENVTMQTLRAYDTTQDLHYITTLALAFIPAAQTNMLNLILKTPSHKIYNNTDKSVRTILSWVNPAIPILSDNVINGASPSQTKSSPSSSATGSVNEGAPIGGSVDNSSPVRASSVGIAAGVVCGAAAYGAAMFFVARRYRKRKQSHRRSPSMISSPVMTGSPHDFIGGANTALMSGGRGDPDRSISPGFYHARDSRGSGRSGSTGRQQISAPVMAENSLGWN